MHVIIVQYSDKFMHSIVFYSIVLRRSQLYCIVYLLLCGYNTIQCYAQICRSIGQPSCMSRWILKILDQKISLVEDIIGEYHINTLSFKLGSVSKNMTVEL